MNNWFNLKLLPFVRQTRFDFEESNKKQILNEAKATDTSVYAFLQNNFDSEAPILNKWKSLIRDSAFDVTADVERVNAQEDIVDIAIQDTDNPRLKCTSFVIGGVEHSYFLCPFCHNRVFAETMNCVFCDRDLSVVAPGGSAYADYISLVYPKRKNISKAYKDRVKIFTVPEESIKSNASLDRFIPMKEPVVSRAAAFIPEDLDTYDEKSENLAPHIVRKSFDSNPLATLQALAQIFRMKRAAIEGEATLPISRGTRILYKSPKVAAEFVMTEKPHLYIYAKTEDGMERIIEKLENANIVSFR